MNSEKTVDPKNLVAEVDALRRLAKALTASDWERIEAQASAANAEPLQLRLRFGDPYDAYYNAMALASVMGKWAQVDNYFPSDETPGRCIAHSVALANEAGLPVTYLDRKLPANRKPVEKKSDAPAPKGFSSQASGKTDDYVLGLTINPANAQKFLTARPVIEKSLKDYYAQQGAQLTETEQMMCRLFFLVLSVQPADKKKLTHAEWVANGGDRKNVMTDALLKQLSNMLISRGLMADVPGLGMTVAQHTAKEVSALGDQVKLDIRGLVERYYDRVAHDLAHDQHYNQDLSTSKVAMDEFVDYSNKLIAERIAAMQGAGGMRAAH